MSKRQIFLVFDCDGWTRIDSMRLVLVTTSPRRLKSFVADKIERGDFKYAGSGNTPRQKAASFKKDFGIHTRDWLNSMLEYGFMSCEYDGEEI